MKIIFSHLSNVNPFTNVDPKINLSLAKLSNFLIQKHGFKTAFWGDQNSIKIFKEIPYDEIVDFKHDYIQEFSPSFWSISKLLAMSEINEPFLHIDHDLFLFKTFYEDFLNQNVIYFHDEFYYDNLIESFQKDFELQPKNIINFKNSSKNCALIGGQNYKILNKISKEILEFILENQELIKNLIKSENIKKYPKFMPAVLTEQVWIFKYLEYYKENSTPYLKEKDLSKISIEGYIHNVCHLQEQKNNDLIQKTLYKMNKYLNL
jgi:hypothetical protein